MRPLPRFYYVLFVFVVAGIFVLVLHGCQGITDPKSGSRKRGPLTTDPNNESRKLNHFIILIQENRSFDTYFGQLSAYWAANGIPQQPFDGMPPGASNQGCDPTSPAPGFCRIGANSQPVSAFHLQTACIELVSPGWNESHVDLNHAAPASGSAVMDGFVQSAGGFARSHSVIHDKNGLRAMGFYDGNDLNYYYFMASNFATSDLWFSPVMSFTAPNRMYLMAATSHGHVYPLFVTGGAPLPDKTIFQLLEEHGISWKIYVHPGPSGCSSTECLLKQSYITMFTFQHDILSKFPQKLAPISEYFSDVAHGTLPNVALIEPASEAGLDEHPSALGSTTNMQVGAKYVSELVNALMHSSSWKDSAFILSYDEFGGLYDHEFPMTTVSPDGRPPSDLQAGDICTNGGGPNCDFTLTGLRVPLIVISPFAKKNFVSHNPADYTAILRLLEHRFSLPSLTARDAFQMDMTEFFDFDNPPWMNPPNPPAQNVNLGCHQDHLP